MTEKKTIAIQNGEVEVVKFGCGKNAFVILPGLSYEGFFDQAEAIARAYGMFAQSFTVYLIDRNKTPRVGDTVREIAADTAEVMEKLGIECADVFGASLGGMVAQELAAYYPHLVHRLVLGSTLSRPNPTFLQVLSRWESLAKAGEIDDLTADFYQAVYSPQTLERYAAVLSQTKTVATPEKTARFLVYLNAAKQFDCFNSLGQIRATTLVLAAKGDRVTTAAAARETAKALGCGYYEYPAFGHAVYDEAPDYQKRVLDFLIGGMQNE